MRLLMIAAPGGGKGTQGEQLAAKFSVQHVSSGEVLRAEARAGSPVGRELAAYQERHAQPPRGSLPAAVCAAGRPGRLPAHNRRRAGRHPHGPVRPGPLAHRGHRHRGRVHRLPAGGKPRAEPRDHEPHGQRQSAARAAVDPGRDSIGGWLGGFFGSFGGRIAFHPGLQVPCRSSRGNCGWLPSGSHRPTARGQPAPDFRSATSKHRRRTASLMTKSRIQARMS